VSIIQRIIKARNEFWFSWRRQLAGPAQTKTIQYIGPRIVQQPAKKEQRIPLFGSDPEIADYSVVRAIAPAPHGVALPNVSRPIVNRSGSAANLEPAMTVGKTEIESETRGPLSYQPTDQRNLGHGGSSPTSNWDGVVRAGQTNPGFQGVRGKSAPTPADLHERDLRNAPYDFSA